jgi:hypothetical protein
MNAGYQGILAVYVLFVRTRHEDVKALYGGPAFEQQATREQQEGHRAPSGPHRKRAAKAINVNRSAATSPPCHEVQISGWPFQHIHADISLAPECSHGTERQARCLPVDRQPYGAVRGDEEMAINAGQARKGPTLDNVRDT